MSNFERDVANAMLDKADERIRDLEAQLERSRSANVYDGNAHRRVSEIEAELAISKGREEGKQLVINQLEAALKEAELQRDSWKRITESGLGIPQTETACEHRWMPATQDGSLAIIGRGCSKCGAWETKAELGCPICHYQPGAGHRQGCGQDGYGTGPMPSLGPIEPAPQDYTVQCICGWMGKVSTLKSLPGFKMGCPFCSQEFVPLNKLTFPVNRQTETKAGTWKHGPNDYDQETKDPMALAALKRLEP